MTTGPETPAAVRLRPRDLDLVPGTLPPGPRNSIADVPGVVVGHRTLNAGELRTGVTAILPHGGDLFRDRPIAASCVLNGFGKSVGLVQLDELGTVETPILLTNTFGVAACANALIRRAIAANPAIGRRAATVNPIVLECNDGFLNDIQAMAVTEREALAAVDAAAADFASGAIGAGTGMSCFGFKGGIGTASRALRFEGGEFHVGVVVLANFGRAGDLRLPDGRLVAPPAAGTAAENGSCIVVIATDVPVDHRQLRRVARRAGVGLAWCGAFWGHGSGDIAVAFTTANRVPGVGRQDFVVMRVLAEGRIDKLFQATAEATQEAVLDALVAAETMTGFGGNKRIGLRYVLEQ